MRITKIRVQNFRLLRDTLIDLEDDLSVIIGKNNCGKTSLLLILDNFIGSGNSKNSFSFDDFNVNFKEELKFRIEGNSTQSETPPFMGISLKLFVEYGEHDDLSNIGNKVIMDLDPDNRVVVLAFEYYLSEDKLEVLSKDYKAHCDKRTADEKEPKDIGSFLKERHAVYFQTSKKSLRYDMELQKEDETVFTDLLKEKIPLDKIISFKLINARRSVSNKDSEKSLSSQSSRIYKKLEANSNNPAVIEDFKDTLSNTDEKLDGIYSGLFKEVIDDIKKFGGIKQDESIIKIVSSLQHKELLEDNATVMYDLGSTDHSLPENYNGLGYMNLISMIFEIKILLHEFQKEKDERPSDINLLFIEEPEVHTHPQMQRIFIKNIKSLLQNGVVREDGENRKLQTILTTHSSHITSESEFDDIKYFKKEELGIVSKNLKDLEGKYSGYEQHYKFLKQYLTLHRSELFFADKAIFIEGDTERILLPTMMKKLDQEDIKREQAESLDASLALLSQNVSIIEVGAYSQVFDKFIDFIGIKSLIITDIDSGYKGIDKNGKECDLACPVADTKASLTTNSSLKFFYGGSKTLANFIALSHDERVLRKAKDKESDTFGWFQDTEGHLLCVYQTKETNAEGVAYHPRSFEDAFFHINRQFISDHIFDEQENFIGNKTFPSLTQQRMKEFAESKIDAEEMAKAVGSKPTFAMEILLNSAGDSDWNTPAYILEGLQWLKQD
jgi:putative ATP-dependent endonuclease of the OLD family